MDAAGKVVCPGLVDCHTHLIFAGERVNEWEQKLQGVSYLDILQAGGGILSTVRATRAAPLGAIATQSLVFLREMLRQGTTTVEIKTGYGLDTANELKLLHAIAALAEQTPLDLVPTLLPAHTTPPEFAGHTDDYVKFIIEEILPAANAWHRASSLAPRPFSCDVFCERHAFDVLQSRQLLTAARALGLGVKLHADQFTELGGVELAVELGAVSVDHLDVTSSAGIRALAGADTLAVVLPAVNFHLGSAHYADARGLIDAGAALALATDFNPGSAPCLSLPLVMAIACRSQHLTPAEALNAITINAAHAIGLGHQVGSLEVGKQADLLVLDTPDYRQLAYWLGRNLVQQGGQARARAYGSLGPSKPCSYSIGNGTARPGAAIPLAARGPARMPAPPGLLPSLATHHHCTRAAVALRRPPECHPKLSRVADSPSGVCATRMDTTHCVHPGLC